MVHVKMCLLLACSCLFSPLSCSSNGGRYDFIREGGSQPLQACIRRKVHTNPMTCRRWCCSQSLRAGNASDSLVGLVLRQPRRRATQRIPTSSLYFSPQAIVHGFERHTGRAVVNASTHIGEEYEAKRVLEASSCLLEFNGFRSNDLFK